MQSMRISDVFSVKKLSSEFGHINRRLWVVILSTFTSVCFTVKMLESFTKFDLITENPAFFIEWALIDMMTGALIWLYHVDTLRDRRRKPHA